jgi:hypothetical protein
MNVFITLKKGLLGFATGLAAAIIFGIIQAISNYKPVVCTAEIVENCTPQFVSTLYYSIIPVVTGGLVAFANWLKNRGKV